MSEDLQKKNADAKQRQARKIKEANQAAASEISNYQLTRKNEDFIYQLQKQLKEQGAKADKIPGMIQETVKSLQEGQKSGKTARAMYGTPTHYAHQLIHPDTNKKPDELKTSSFPQLALDNTIMLLAIFTIMYGIMGLLPNNSIGKLKVNGAAGITAIVIISVVGGLTFGYITKLMEPVKDETTGRWKKRPVGMRIGLTIAAFVIWLLAYLLVNLLPNVINPVLNSWIELVIGVVAILGDIYYRRKYHIVGSAFSTRQPNRRQSRK
ncbi:DUF1129 domain-containing protein [Limosilactobacillus difficilis]|uniref:DUF1129 domain-containing protein n=1 Tax=Limosilactobacillus difficilis TaxID=2991838 RepID=UPI0024B94AB0|nr:DUF1129 family protein [Limosilactobacillus difficilis]